MPLPADRRLARGAATRDALVQAAVDLLLTGDLRPTSRDVASRAGVSRRLVFHHFSHLDLLLSRAVTSQLDQVALAAPPHGPVDVRIDVLCRQRRDLFERLDPVLVAATWLRHGARPPSTAVRSADAVLHPRLRQQLVRTFAPELGRFDGDDARTVLDWLDAVTGWEYWRVLRTRVGLDSFEAERRTAGLVRRVLEVD